MSVRRATDADFTAFLQLAAEVESLFGPMVNEPGFHDAVRRNIQRGSALVATDPDSTAVVGGLLFSRHHPTYEVSWLVVATPERSRGHGEALLAEAFRTWVRPPCAVEVVTFGADHPGARGRSFYRRLGFEPAETLENGPEGGSRQRFRRHLEALPPWCAPPTH